MFTEEQVFSAVTSAIMSVTGKVFDSDRNLIDRDAEIHPVSFLYIFSILEKELQVPVFKIFETNTYEVMTISALSKAIWALQKN